MDADEFAQEALGLHERLARCAMAVCGDRTIAEECAAEALLRAWERVDAGEELRSLEAWTMTVALNACRTRLRSLGAERRALQRVRSIEVGGGLADGGARSDTDTRSATERPSEEVMAALMALPDRQREVVSLFYLEDMSTTEIAEITDSSANSVRNALHHARAALARTLGATQSHPDADPALLDTDPGMAQ